MGGWKARPGSCSRGFRSRPSRGGGNTRSKGLEVNSMKVRNPIEIQAWTPSTRVRRLGGRLAPKPATAAPKRVRISTHNNMEPS
jgi:hypothetical protein